MTKKEFIFWLVLLILLLYILVLLSGCSAGYHLRRAEHHLKKAELKGATIKVDTVYLEKKIVVQEVKTDTVFHTKEGDTIYVSRDRLKIKYVKLPGDSVFIEGKCEADTVEIKVPFTVTKEITAPKGLWYYFPWILFVLALATVAYFIRSFRK